MQFTESLARLCQSDLHVEVGLVPVSSEGESGVAATRLPPRAALQRTQRLLRSSARAGGLI